MSSLEIAERTGKSHDNVLRDIRVMLEALGDGLKFEGIYRDRANRQKPCFHLPKRECLVLVTGYSIPMRAAVGDRWQELEAQVAAPAGPALPDFSNPAAF
ncbi:MAG: Rha family transcriptional regulator [Methylorubrum rhodinum]|uniref:Rha family transcriptional regulator n=1 Tax=Methylorubrum rhodinum TaxID=29428 RepID=UPI003BB21D0A